MNGKIGSRSLKNSHIREYLMNLVLSMPEGAKLPGIR